MLSRIKIGMGTQPNAVSIDFPVVLLAWPSALLPDEGLATTFGPANRRGSQVRWLCTSRGTERECRRIRRQTSRTARHSRYGQLPEDTGLRGITAGCSFVGAELRKEKRTTQPEGSSTPGGIDSLDCGLDCGCGSARHGPSSPDCLLCLPW
jgi:hypothetical protein